MININKKKQKKYKTITISIEVLILVIAIISAIISILKNNFTNYQNSHVIKNQKKIYKDDKYENNGYNDYSNSTNYDNYENNNYENSTNPNNRDIDEYKNSTNYDKGDKLKLISTYTTKLSTEREKEKNRVHNIKKAAAFLNNTTIKPNEKFSFHKTVWENNKYKEYKYADTLTQNGMDKGLGGGICQVSSTLFVAALKADMKITERSPHSHQVTYVPIGIDASYETNSKDFSFVNTLSHPIKIKTYFNNDFLTVNIFSEYDGNKNHTILIKPAQIIKDTKNYVTVDVAIEKKCKNKLLKVTHIKSRYKK